MNFNMCFSFYGETNLWCGLGISMMFSLHGHMEKKNFKNLWKTKIITNLVSSLYIIPVKIVSLFLTWRSNYQVVSLHIKPTDRHQYLHFTSSYRNQTKGSIVYSQALRVRRIYSWGCDLLKHILEMKYGS